MSISMSAQNNKEEEWLYKIELLVKSFAEAKSKRAYLEHFRKSKIAMLKTEAETKDPLKYKTDASRDTYARQHTEYLELLKALQEATKSEETHRWNLKQREWKFEQYRTQQANQRAERQRYGA